MQLILNTLFPKGLTSHQDDIVLIGDDGCDDDVKVILPNMPSDIPVVKPEFQTHKK